VYVSVCLSLAALLHGPRFNLAGLKVGRVADPAHFDLPRLYRVSLGSNFTKDKFLENACQNAPRLAENAPESVWRWASGSFRRPLAGFRGPTSKGRDGKVEIGSFLEPP